VKRRPNAREETTQRPWRDDPTPVERRPNAREETTQHLWRDDPTPVRRPNTCGDSPTFINT